MPDGSVTADHAIVIGTWTLANAAGASGTGAAGAATVVRPTAAIIARHTNSAVRACRLIMFVESLFAARQNRVQPAHTAAARALALGMATLRRASATRRSKARSIDNDVE